MSSSCCQWTTLRPFVFGSVMVLCFLFFFFTYNNFEIKFPTFGTGMGEERHSNLNCSADTKQIQTAPVDTEPDTIVLIWRFPFGGRHDVGCDIYNIKGCKVTDDRSLYDKAHGVLFHHRDIQGSPGSLPTQRPRHQKWVWFNMESPANSATVGAFNHLFNLTCNYRLDSTVPVPYGYLVPVTPESKSFKLPAKNKLVCWIVSNWNPNFKRVQFYNELKKHVTIHTYGNAFGKGLSGEDYMKTVSSCKFYLSFENSIFRDYMTEKLFRPMSLGSVPVVLGPSRQNYEDHVPGDSFIHVDDFSTPKELADRLLYLDNNDSEYMRYFNWTNSFQVQECGFGREHACRACSYIRTHRQYQVFHDLNKWYWG